MGELGAVQPRPRGPRVFEGPVVLKRTRSNIAELAGLLWLVIEVVRLGRRALQTRR